MDKVDLDAPWSDHRSAAQKVRILQPLVSNGFNRRDAERGA
jgi:hypothetical protein